MKFGSALAVQIHFRNSIQILRIQAQYHLQGKWGDDSGSELDDPRKSKTSEWPAGRSSDEWPTDKPSKAEQTGDGWRGHENGRSRPAEDSWAPTKAYQEAGDDSGWGGKEESRPAAAAKSKFDGKKPDNKGAVWVSNTPAEGELLHHSSSVA